MKKKLKNLINSVSNGGKIEGALNKIHEVFIKEITDEVNLFESRKDSLKNKIKESLENAKEALSEGEERVKKIKVFLENVDFAHLERIEKDLSEKFNNISKTYDEKIKCINNRSDVVLKEIAAKKLGILGEVQKEISEQRKYLNEQVKIWRESIEHDFDSLSKQNELYMENEGLRLFANYIRNNAHRVLWNLILGFFCGSKKK